MSLGSPPRDGPTGCSSWDVGTCRGEGRCAGESPRTTGLRLAAVATASWAVFVVAITMSDPDDGVPIGTEVFCVAAVLLSATAPPVPPPPC